ncbi:DUF2218 domain-containing protein [Sphaerimonospora thailandensis]|uniref:DUF2218 domain-containing protein n=1 Tax=Sphaerimonospora thailandensis TaxID=795644 RepID=A0A8J3VX30_9ACTN|nr:DUF2218 domain-containing protein [Sphaerimonospora thailandensis]GIH68494.1 hypothetical protein Mth01_07470 [Sphaerimonospora thailandensis]
MPSSTAFVVTDAAERYAKQLASHLGRKIEVEELPDGVRRLVFAKGDAVLTPEPERLVMRADAEDAASLAVVEDVVGRHLERFGQRNELAVTWQKDS